MRDLERTDITTSAFKARAHDFYARLRAQHPAQRIVLRNRKTAWLITRYGDVLEALKDQRLVKSARNVTGAKTSEPWMPASFRPLSQNMLDLDPPRHTRLRSLVHRGFTPRRVEALRVRIETLTNDLLTRALERRHVDLVREYALPLPTTIIAELIGVPPSDRHRFHKWSAAIVSVSLSPWSMIKAIPNGLAFLRYLRALVRSRSADPRDDLISALIQTSEDGDVLSEDELVAMIFLLLVAGHETTVNLIANGTFALLQHPQQMEKLRADGALIETGVEEMLRYYSPVELATERYASADIDWHGQRIRRGELVYGVLASANRDERQFTNPDNFDVTRNPNRHLAFGQGIHFCLGAPLARLEAQIAIRTLLDRTDEVRLTIPVDGVIWRKGLNLRGLKKLPLGLTRA